jgi:hypothetical protein
MRNLLFLTALLAASPVDAVPGLAQAPKGCSGTPSKGSYTIKNVPDPRHVCEYSIRGGKAAPACVNLSIIRGQVFGVIIMPPKGTPGYDRLLQHEFAHLNCPNWMH